MTAGGVLGVACEYYGRSYDWQGGDDDDVVVAVAAATAAAVASVFSVIPLLWNPKVRKSQQVDPCSEPHVYTT
jgi:hypothetical protein